MTFMKKAAAALCSASTLLALGASLTASAAGTLTIAGTQVEVSADDPDSMKGIAITMSIENNPNYATSGIGIRYDERLTPVLNEDGTLKYETGTAVTGALTVVELDDSQSLIGWGSVSYTNIKGDGDMLTVYFDLPADAAAGDVYEIVFEVDQVCNDAKEELEFATRNGKITVTAATTTETTTTTTETTTTTTETTTTTTETTTTTTETTTTTTETTTTTSDTTTTTTTSETTTTTADDVETGDAGVALAVAGLLTAAGTALVVRKKRG